MLARALPVRVLVPFVLAVFAAVASPQEARVERGTRVVLTGSVRLADGAPAAGAVVATSAGGTAVAGADGGFEIETAMPVDAERLELTAALEGPRGRAEQTASLQVVPSALASSTSLGSIALSAGGESRWLPTFGGQPGVGVLSIPTVTGPPFVHSMVVHDDGSGPALYVSGDFSSAGGVAVKNIARWDGARWSAVGNLNVLAVHALEVFDDGSGPVLCAGGDFSGVRRWNGSSWSSLGTLSGWHNPINALLSFDDGSGPALYAAGRFTNAAGVVCNNIARWNGTSWSALGTGTNGEVSALAVFDDGSGPALYAAGWFTSAGGTAANRLAKWNGSAWSALGSGLNSVALTLTTFDDGSGPALFAGGLFSTAGGGAASRIARWNGTTWAALGAGMDDQVMSLATFDDGSGPALYAGGRFEHAGGVAAARLARWNGATWQALGSGADEEVDVLAVFDDGNGPALHAGGELTVAGGIGANRVARWDGAAWAGLGVGASMDVRALTTFDDGGGEALYAGGAFTSVDGLAANHVARWNGARWSTLGSGVGGVFPGDLTYVSALAVFDDGGGEALYAGGQFTSAGGAPANFIARWDGASWSPLGTGMNDVVGALCVYDDGSGPALYAGGAFTTAGGVAAQRIARWNGSSWSALGAGIDAGLWVGALTVFDLGGGPELLVGGYFQQAGGVPVGSLAAWDGSGWADVAGGVGFGTVEALAAYDDGGGLALVVGGDFTAAGGLPANSLARFRGGSWSTLGGGVAGYTVPVVLALTAFDDGTGPALFVGGRFGTAGGLAASRIARWNGSSWSAMGPGVSSDVRVFGQFGDGVSRSLLVGGFFDVSPKGDSFLARWGRGKFRKHP